MPQYLPLSAEDNPNNHDKFAATPRRSKLYAVFLVLLVLFGLSVATWIYSLKPALPSPQLKPSNIISCGVTPTQARSNGCLFDVMSFSWLPPACYDELLVADFLALQPWDWFSDSLGTEPVSLEVALKGDAAQMYVSWQYHITHCVFMWKKMHRALKRDGVIDAYIGNYNHTSHCGHMLMMVENKTSTV